MRCPFCSFEESKVVDSRSTDDNTTIRRRRECLNCNKRYTTYEKVEDIPILVVKRDLTRENFNKEKIVNGLIIACQKRPVSRKQIEEIAEDIEKKIIKHNIPSFPYIAIRVSKLYSYYPINSSLIKYIISKP